MKAHLIYTYLLVSRSRSSAKVKVKYQGHVSQKMGVSGALGFHKHILLRMFWVLFCRIFQMLQEHNFWLAKPDCGSTNQKIWYFYIWKILEYKT